jgi:hypothetical protein
VQTYLVLVAVITIRLLALGPTADFRVSDLGGYPTLFLFLSRIGVYAYRWTGTPARAGIGRSARMTASSAIHLGTLCTAAIAWRRSSSPDERDSGYSSITWAMVSAES